MKLSRFKSITPGRSYLQLNIKKSASLWISLVLVIIILLIYQMRSGTSLNEFQIRTLVNGGIALSLASIGLAMIIISGGFDASVGAVITVINVIAATTLKDHIPTDIAICATLIVLGTLIGAINGFLIAYAGIQSIIATLATSFVWFGVSLLLLAKPGGFVPHWINVLFQGSYIKNIPNSAIWLLLLIIAITFFRKTKFYRAIYAVGSDPEAAYRNGINVKLTRLKVYATAGFLYALSGLFLSAQTTSGDPNIGAAFMLLGFSAVVVGGTPFGGGKGSLYSGISGAYILRLLDSMLISIGVTSYFNDIFQGSILLITVIIGSMLPKLRAMLIQSDDA